MLYTSQHLQKLYAGFCNTPTLWTGDTIFNLKQLQIKNFSERFQKPQERRLRLGQLAEQFVFNQLETSENFRVLAENLQIQNEKLTVGEIDALIELNNKPIHLEIVYKFFLYDDTSTETELKKWIGPNRKDSLMEKTDKLLKKQLPLLYSSFTTTYLNDLGLKPEQIEQQVLFKAQLFTPFGQQINVQKLNSESLYGHYFRLQQLKDFQEAKFYIPRKLDWFLEPEAQIEWMNYINFKDRAELFLNDKRSFMFWSKTPNGLLFKGFLVWW